MVKLTRIIILIGVTLWLFQLVVSSGLVLEILESQANPNAQGFKLPSLRTPITDPNSPKVDRFIEENLSRYVKIKGDEAWCTKYSPSPSTLGIKHSKHSGPSSRVTDKNQDHRTSYHLTGVTINKQPIPISPGDKSSDIHLRLQITVMSAYYRESIQKNDWSSRRIGCPVTLSFTIESVNGKLYWDDTKTQNISAS